MILDIHDMVRPNIRKLIPYASARKEFNGKAMVFMDANENPFGSPLSKNYNRYPDPLQQVIKEKIAVLNHVATENIFLGNGSDEAIDLLFRIFCEPGKDDVIVCPPTYGIYETSASINNVGVIKINLNDAFQPDVEKILATKAKMIFLCSPNNPTGNLMNNAAIESILQGFEGIVIIDEAYIDYAGTTGYLPVIDQYPNLVVIRTLSKAWGLAGLRLGMAFASPLLISWMNNVKYPYNISEATIELVAEALSKKAQVQEQVSEIISLRNDLITRLEECSFIIKVFPSDANFILASCKDVRKLYTHLLEKGIVTRIRDGYLRITVGTETENNLLINALNKFYD